jgi:hypothetical protein
MMLEEMLSPLRGLGHGVKCGDGQKGVSDPHRLAQTS